MRLTKSIAATVALSLLTTTAFASQRVNVGPDKPVFKSFVGGEFVIRDAVDREIAAKLAVSPAGELFECFDRNPKSFSQRPTSSVKVRFEANLYFCVAGFAILENAGFSGRLIRGPSSIESMLDRARQKVAAVATPTKSMTESEKLGCSHYSGTYSVALRAPKCAANKRTDLTVVIDASPMRKSTLVDGDDDEDEWEGQDLIDLPDGWGNVIADTWGSAPNNSICATLLRAMLAACVASGPAYPECVAAAVLIYLMCLKGGT